MKIPNIDAEICSVAELTQQIRMLLEEGIGEVLVVGEISNFKTHTSGHRYFTLKDGEAQIQCVMWKTRRLGFAPADGMRVVVSGRLTVYPARGNYQIDCVTVRPEGIGDLYAAFAKLKADLEQRGWFDALGKKPLPRLPTSVGIATSGTGAAAHDMFSTIQRRYPPLDVVFRPTVVQGAEAAADIVNAIRELQSADVDVIIVGRGGGSIEDLWCFNTEAVAKAIYESSIPIISAVGHETDFTIADFVADVRAATPTAAAELVTPFTKTDLLLFVEEFRSRLIDSMQENVSELQTMAESFLDGTAARRVLERIMNRVQRTDELHLRVSRSMAHAIENLRHRLTQVNSQLSALHPYRPLRLGYAIIERAGHVLRAADELGAGDTVELVRSHQRATAEILNTKFIEDNDYGQEQPDA
ncbi:MAG: exodeoxyribonuclease VII large subunit [Ignavibacteria bacterium]|nr:exodeoxyribonuclease VII large subunit [Ignavibacteria bacterium]